MLLEVINGNQPVIEKKIMNTGGVEREYGLSRDRNTEGGWGQWRWSAMERAKEVDTNNLPPTERKELVHILVEDLVDWCGVLAPIKLRAKLEEFGVEFNFK